VLGHVDVLGVRQEVVAPVDGLIGALNVQPGEAIEFGQPVARIDPPEAAIAPVEA
jgi:biotin carboxyl carrier protein